MDFLAVLEFLIKTFQREHVESILESLGEKESWMRCWRGSEMLSAEERKEMLEDAADRRRRDHFRVAGAMATPAMSFDEYLRFLNQIQEAFAPFKISRRITRTEKNKL
jgi:hypothetical protein